MQFNGESYFSANPDRELSVDEATIKKLFEFTDLSIEDISKNLSPVGQEKIDNLVKSFTTGIVELEKLKQEYDTIKNDDDKKQKTDLAVLLRNIEAKLGSIGSSRVEIEKTLIDIKVKNQITSISFANATFALFDSPLGLSGGEAVGLVI